MRILDEDFTYRDMIKQEKLSQLIKSLESFANSSEKNNPTAIENLLTHLRRLAALVDVFDIIRTLHVFLEMLEDYRKKQQIEISFYQKIREEALLILQALSNQIKETILNLLGKLNQTLNAINEQIRVCYNRIAECELVILKSEKEIINSIKENIFNNISISPQEKLRISDVLDQNLHQYFHKGKIEENGLNEHIEKFVDKNIFVSEKEKKKILNDIRDNENIKETVKVINSYVSNKESLEKHISVLQDVKQDLLKDQDNLQEIAKNPNDNQSLLDELADIENNRRKAIEEMEKGISQINLNEKKNDYIEIEGIKEDSFYKNLNIPNADNRVDHEEKKQSADENLDQDQKDSQNDEDSPRPHM